MTNKKKSRKKSEASIRARKKRKKVFLEALKLSAGNVSIACSKADISRNTAYRWYNEDPEFREAWIEVKESLLDMAESMLLKAIKEGKTTELIFYLKTQGKKRGYVESMENYNTNLNIESDMSDEEILEKYNKLIEEQMKFDELKRKVTDNKEGTDNKGTQQS